MNLPIIRPVVLFFYLLLLVLGLTFPSSGSHSSIHPKSFSFMALSLALVSYYTFFKRTLGKRELDVFFGLSLFLIFALFWLIVGLLNPRIEGALPLDQFKLFVITCAPLAFSLLLYFDQLISFSLFLKTLLYANGLYIVFKLGVAIALLFKLISFEKLVGLLGIRAMNLAIFGDFQRFQTSMDIVTPFLLFFCLEAGSFSVRLPKLFKALFPPLAMLSTLISFSRVLIFIGLIGYVLHFCLHSVRHFFKGVILVILALAGLVVLVGPDNVYKMVEVRLFSRENRDSDEIRSVQVEALLEEVLKHPLLGMGMGGYSEKEVRDLEIKHSYEVQWVALYAQLGALGIGCLVMPLIVFTWFFFSPPIQSVSVALSVLWCGWIASGFTNPFVISLTSGIMYSLFTLAYLEMKRFRSYHSIT